MQSTTTTVIATCLAVLLLLLVPVMALTTRNDNVVQEKVQLYVDEFVLDIQNTGKITKEKYQEFSDLLAATGNIYDIELEIQHLDENPGKKTAQANYTKIGENVYYSEYTTQILKQLGIGESSLKSFINLKEGDRVVVSVKNTNDTAAQTLKGFILNSPSSGQYTIYASSTGMINVNGN